MMKKHISRKLFSEVKVLPGIIKSNTATLQPRKPSVTNYNLIPSSVIDPMKSKHRIQEIQDNEGKTIELRRFRLDLTLKAVIESHYANVNILSTKLNNELLLAGFMLVEEPNYFYLHKNSNDGRYYIVVKGIPVDLKEDPEKAAYLKNEEQKYVAENFVMDKFAIIAGANQDADMKSLAEAEEALPEEVQEEFRFTINIINKNAEGLVFYVIMTERSLAIERIQFIENFKFQDMSKDEFENINLYHGPKFDTLNPKLQESITNFIESIGVTPEIGKYIKYIGLNKRRRQELKWHTDIVNFISI